MRLKYCRTVLLGVGAIGLASTLMVSGASTANPPDACKISGRLVLTGTGHFTLHCDQDQCSVPCGSDTFTFQETPTGPPITGIRCTCEESWSTHCCQVIKVNDTPYAWGACGQDICPMTGPTCELTSVLDPHEPPTWADYDTHCVN